MLLLCGARPAAAHNGPPYPIIVDLRVGPCMISVWTHPDVGIGTFWVIVKPPQGATVPKDLKVEIGVQPISGRLPEKRYGGQIEESRDSLQYNYQIPFDAQERWRVHVFLTSSQGNGQAVAAVEVTPPGLGRWDLLLYAAPFAAVGFLWFRALMRKRKRSR
jgi:hypothetical protein